MSENQVNNVLASKTLVSRLFICIFPPIEPFTQALTSLLSKDRYILRYVEKEKEFIDFVEDNKEKIDCLLFFADLSRHELLQQLYFQGVLLPIIILEENKDSIEDSSGLGDDANFLYHQQELRLPYDKLEEIGSKIDRAIANFLHLAPSCSLDTQGKQAELKTNGAKQDFLVLHQRRLADKLQERLGYLGVYYKRNPQDFYRNLSAERKQAVFDELSGEYRQIILGYFEEEVKINQLIDRFVNHAFFTDISVSQILEMHMELMDEFAQHLKLEGRSEEILLDYRLTLIDIVAHLCEMYRRSIPREELPFELRFRGE